MAAILGRPYDEVNEVLSGIKEGVVAIANWNSAEQLVIAGQDIAVRKACELMKPTKSILLPVSAPFHCELMKSAREKLSNDMDLVEFKDPRFPVICNVDAEIIRKGREAKDALKRQVTGAVLWYKSMDIIKDQGVEQCVELGAGRVLSGLMKRISRKWPLSPEIFNISDPETLEKVSQNW